MQSKQSFSWSQVSAFRLTRHHLSDQNKKNLNTISQSTCGIQAQVMAAAEMQLWARAHKISRADIHSALWENRSLVKTSAMRGTLHVLSASDYLIYINAIKRSRTRAMQQIMSRYGVTQKKGNDVTKAVVEILDDGPMTRSELTKHVISLKMIGKNAKEWYKLSWWGVVRQAMVEGLVCYGHDQGRKVTLVRVDQWLPNLEEVSEQDAKRIFFSRYLAAYGPATLQDFAKWSGISMQEVRTIRQEMAKELVEVGFEDKEGLILLKDFDQLRKSSLDGQVLCLLPHFDPFMLGHVDKNQLVDSKFYKRVYRKAGWISPVILLNGRVIGVWSYTRKSKRLFLGIEPFVKFSKTIFTRIEEEAASLGGFWQIEFEINFVK